MSSPGISLLLHKSHSVEETPSTSAMIIMQEQP
jgi:hypothetical protein